MKLGERLVAAGLVTREQVDAALQGQVLYGRRLGTNLLEAGAIDEERLGAALAEHLGVAYADESRFQAADPGVRELVGMITARRCLAFPLGYEGDELLVALADPLDARALMALRAAAGMSIRAMVAPERRIREELDRHEPKPAPAPVVRRGLPTRPLRIGPRTRTAAVPPVPADESLARLASARSRDEIGDELIRFARGRVDTGILFYVKGARAQAWKAFGPGVDPSPPGLDAFAFSLALPSPLETAYRDREPWRGHPVELALPDALETLQPNDPTAEMIIFPVIVAGYVVNLFAVSSRLAHEEALTLALAQAADGAGQAYARLIRESKASPDK
jgi:type II secretion system (T2SS) protein E